MFRHDNAHKSSLFIYAIERVATVRFPLLIMHFIIKPLIKIKIGLNKILTQSIKYTNYHTSTVDTLTSNQQLHTVSSQ